MAYTDASPYLAVYVSTSNNSASYIEETNQTGNYSNSSSTSESFNSAQNNAATFIESTDITVTYSEAASSGATYVNGSETTSVFSIIDEIGSYWDLGLSNWDIFGSVANTYWDVTDPTSYALESNNTVSWVEQ